MQKFIQIKKGMSMVKTKEGVEVILPSRVSKGTKNYQFDVERQILQKKCINCNEYFDMDQIIDGEFVDIHDETQIKDHKGKSEMSSRCVKCFKEQKVEQVKRKAEELGFLPGPHREEVCEIAKDVESTNNKFGGIKLTNENYKYIAHIAVENDLSVDEQINKEVERLRRVNTLKIDYQEKVK